MSREIVKDDADGFIAKWKGVVASELSTSQSFLIDLCRLLDVDTPHPTAEQDYMFERPITFAHGDGTTSPGRTDLYRRGAFVLESKKLDPAMRSQRFDKEMLSARGQAERYARSLPAAEGRPPLLLVVDIGNRIEFYADFTRSGATYTPYPDPRSHRIALDELHDEAIRDRLRRAWVDPMSLDPSREYARVTRQIAAKLADLARSLEQGGHAPEAVAQFLMRCLFTMFAEDVRLLPATAFRDLLGRHREQPDVAMRMLAQLWRDMDAGGFCAAIASDVLRFNGKLFKQPDTLPLDADQIGLLIKAANTDWKHVEPAIFGTLLERALSPSERHKLGAHYTPRAYVERLVLPTVIEPLRREWSDAHAAALTLAAENKPDDAAAELHRFHHRLCTVRVLDPACGSGNFLYVTLEHLKRLEGEVLNALAELGDRQAGLGIDGTRADARGGETVDPHNLLGIELNPRAAAIAEVVLWIGYLQWHFRTRGDVSPPQPVIRDFANIECRDAVLAYDDVEFVTDARGVPVSRWDGETMKISPVTGEKIPDETAQKQLERYINPRKAAWPAADFVVGNPPFIGSKRMRVALGDGYVDALQAAWPQVPQSSDLVMRWWHIAALLTRAGKLTRFGFITTNSLRQSYVRRAIEPHLEGNPTLSLAFAIPDHPWVDSADGANVRIAMTVGVRGTVSGKLVEVLEEQSEADQGDEDLVRKLKVKFGKLNVDLTVGVDVTGATRLRANSALCSVGMKTIGASFQVDRQTAEAIGLGSVPNIESYIRPYINGRDLASTERGIYIVDFFGLAEADVRQRFTSAYQYLLEHARPGRLQNRNRVFRDVWWVIGHPRQQFRRATALLSRYVATIETAKHRFFAFVPIDVTPDSTLVTFALDDAYGLAVLSSVAHVVWSLSAGGRLGVGNDPRYNKSRCFEPFSFPLPSEAQRIRLAELGEQLDAHRKRQQAAHSGLTLTGMYNVLEKLRSGVVLNAKERTIHEQGLVSVLRQLHDEIDAAVLEAYGWSDLLPALRIAHGNNAPVEGQSRADAKREFDEAILERLVALNAERAAEEARGLVRWLRPEFQNPDGQTPPDQTEIETGSEDTAAAPQIIPRKVPWPRDPVAQVRAVSDALSASPVPLSADEIAAGFSARGTWKKRIPQLLDMLVALGRATEIDNKHYRTAR